MLFQKKRELIEMNSVIEKILVNELNSRFDTTKEGNNKLRKISRMYNTELKGEV